jgi:putative aldouronate transport system permease protein
MRKILYDLKKNPLLFLFLAPGLVFFLLFKYWPILGLSMAFQEYSPFLGVHGSPWVGFAQFGRMLSDPDFIQVTVNTMLVGVCYIVFFFPIPVVISILLNEVLHPGYKRIVQTLVYIPHFISWVVIYGITYALLSTDGGAINNLLSRIGLDPIPFLASKDWFYPVMILQMIWHEGGWGTIIILAALTSVNPELYEACAIDGGNRFHRIRHIVFPAILSTIVILLLLRLGSFMDIGFEQILMLVNTANRPIAEVIQTYVYRIGIVQGQFSYTTAVGLFKSAVSIILVLGTNSLIKKFGGEGIF